LQAAEYHGQVTFGGLPVPGATVTAMRAEKRFTAITDQQGTFFFSELVDGDWSIEVSMLCFAPLKQEITIPATTAARFELQLLPIDRVNVAKQAVTNAPAAPEPKQQETQKAEASPPPPPSDLASDGFLINGSENNGAASPFAQAVAFGNNRTGSKGLYNGSLGVIAENSIWDARSFSLTGQNTPKPAYNHFTAVGTLGGPLKIPHVMEHGPNFFIGYQWTRNRTAMTDSGLVPTQAQRDGFLNNSAQVPASRISPQALSLLNLYPLSNFAGSDRYNYQAPVVEATHQDAMQARLNKSLGRRDQLFGGVALQNIRSDSNNLFGFLDATDSLGLAANATWSHRFGQRTLNNIGYQFSRYAAHVYSYFEDRENISGLAGIGGNDQAPIYWGPPSLTFASGITSLSDAVPSFNRNQTSGISDAVSSYRGRHNLTMGGDFRRQEFNYLTQQNPRGAFTFTGAASGNDFADFLLGSPDTASIAFGNADKYFRESVYDAYFVDDWRVNPDFTVNAGLRWEYGAPVTERYDRLANLDIMPFFAQAAPVAATNPIGPLTRTHYASSLLRPDKNGFEPRVAISWRPISGSSLIVRSGYGIYRDTSVYQNIAVQMSQQPPFSKTLSAQNSAAQPLTLATGFEAMPLSTPNTYAIDPDFRVGYAHISQLSLQRDLPGALQMTATFQGVKGTRGVQEFLPNTAPPGSANVCLTCPIGFSYFASNGNSTREAASLQLRRRMHNGFTATAQYTFSKSIDDDAALGSPARSSAAQTQNAFSPPVAPTPANTQGNLLIAQNWLNLRGERSLSSFDQRHLFTLILQYTTGMGTGGGTLLSGWRGALLKEWTVQTQITAGSGFPETPIYLQAVPGTGVTGTVRPSYTGMPLYAAPSGLFLNPAAYVPPAARAWGNAGRNTITGPAQFTLNASLGRTFRLSDRYSLDLRVDSVNALNHVNFTAWNTVINSAQFGFPAGANAMRTLDTSLRVRF
jgi:hypothetical protein